MLIGEFIRRNHTRLAHDIARFGIPAHSGFLPVLSTSADLSFADMVGVVARSHGLELRPCLEYIDRYYDLRDYTGAHLAFDMVVLRIADYLQIQSNRAPRQYSDIKKIRSPLSANEWKVHQSVSNIHQTHDDPEAIFIQALPDGNLVYLRLRSWLSDLQNELDKSWAALGEVYGRFREQSLDRLGLRIRRVRSNLDDIDKFAESVSYIPGDFRLSVDNVEVLGLLVGPLYGNNLLCGVRELVQNSVDAVREIEELILSGIPVTDKDRVNCKGDVEVIVSQTSDGPVLRVRDRGLGMPLNVLENYFLRAGASFRRSDDWREHFENQKGESKVLRSGRFGIGVLAAFLLGRKVTVQSKSILSRTEPGYELTAYLNEDPIEIRTCDVPIGTQISIPLSSLARDAIANLVKNRFTFDQLSAAFYGLQTPKLHLEVFGKILTPAYFCAQTGSEKGWHSASHGDYDAIYWRHSESSSDYAQHVQGTFCNGIWIPQQKISEGTIYLNKRKGISIRFPQVSIFDRNGRLPVSLNRNSVNWDEASCVNAIAKSVVLELLEHMQSNDIQPPRYRHPALNGDSFPFVICKNGVTLADAGLLETAGITRILRIIGFSGAKILAATDTLPSDCGVMIARSNLGSVSSLVNILRKSDWNPSPFKKRDETARMFVISNYLVERHALSKSAPEYQRREFSASSQLAPAYTYVEAPKHKDLRAFCEILVRGVQGSLRNERELIELQVEAPASSTEHDDGSPALLSTVWIETFGRPLATRDDVRDGSGNLTGFRLRKARD
jgi:molecular chaperone HtpG